jgi:hypothetical protein
MKRLSLALAALSLAACATDAGRSPLEPSAAPHKVSGRAATAMAARAVALPFRGTLDAVETTTFPPGTGTALVQLEGTGTATRLGRYTVTGAFTVSTATLAGAGTLTFTAANGDVLTATVTSQATPTDGGAGATLVEAVTITGGTGRFAGATGSFTLERALSFISGVSSGAFAGTITPAK